MVILEADDPDIAELIVRYNRWRRIYGYAGEPPPDEADWDGGRLYFRFGYPYPDWWAYILEGTDDGYRVLRASTERSIAPVESSMGIFARIKDAGKFMIYQVAESLRINCRLEPLSWKWDDAGLDPRVYADIQSDQVVNYSLRSNPHAYIIMTRGDMPYSHILALSYDELDAELLDGFPQTVTSRIDGELR
ncbi:hypothetical protein [Mycobacterium sp. 852002-50816_SCH5313054-b]|uniref:hypothetical protein n=1 Tax=Mycobacterium sp. 852002-50816_SCH5313054-b TaxID=1834092 RepID=UPI0012E9A2DE|nr:hypothetical protein [Mycobacterium sp. 852002-50816_SCH5313054-b]